jgi:hypothetical protein
MSVQDRSAGSKFALFHRGELESAGLAEVAHFIKKAKQQLDNARYAIENTDFSATSEMLNPADNKIAEIGRLIIETRRAIEVAEVKIARSVEEIETEAGQE